MATVPNAHEHGRACPYERGGFRALGPWIAICAGHVTCRLVYQEA
jgi:hypothetical protein